MRRLLARIVWWGYRGDVRRVLRRRYLESLETALADGADPVTVAEWARRVRLDMDHRPSSSSNVEITALREAVGELEQAGRALDVQAFAIARASFGVSLAILRALAEATPDHRG